MVSFKSLVAFLATAGLVSAAPSADLIERQSSSKLVFCHFMIGIVSDRSSAADYDADMQRAKAYGIDAFALNIGVDPYTDAQLELAYQSAANNGMKVFISFDFNWYHPGSDSTAVGQKIAQYASKPAQLYVDNKVFVSSFAGDGLDVNAMRQAAGVPVFWAPNYHPDLSSAANVDGALNWMGWDNDGNNKAPKPGQNVTVAQGDATYKQWLSGKPYIAPVSPWFSTHFGKEVDYSKNWVFPGDLLWHHRWEEILTLKPDYIEIVTWNDYGESHYVGPLNSKHTDDGGSRWVNDMPHDGWLDLAKPYIAAYKAGASSVNSYITGDQLVYWYRPTPRGVNCDATDTTMEPANNSTGNFFMGRPDGWESMDDSVFVVSLLTAAGDVTITSGGNTQKFTNVPAGAQAFEVPMGVGKQSFSLSRGGSTVLSGDSLKDIIDGCICGLYNFNAYVGTLPAGFADPLGPDGLARFNEGLKVACAATPSLGTPAATPSSTRTSTTLSTSTSTTLSTSTRSTTTTTTTTTMTTTSQPGQITTTTTSTTTAPGTTGTCAGGTVAPGMSGNYIGLCDFACSKGYCPPGPCVCTSTGVPQPTPPVTGQRGCPLPNEDDSYLGLCDFACNHGYCPDTACMYC
ncbi:hypothetical protein GQ53DRAFT_137907 [Thozetella sp. PMI_491]|nr:hypothetical protein GQ53DRAFT_137907 [Thozetella sp. PMI_491]